MGLADALAAGLGQGLDQGAQNYRTGLAAAQQLAYQQQQMQQQATTFQQSQAQRALDATQQGGLMAARAGNWQGAAQAANQVAPLYNAATGANLPMPSPIVGSPRAPLAYQGPTPSGAPLPTVQQGNDFTGPLTQAAVRAGLMLAPQTTEVPYGGAVYRTDPITGQTTEVAANAHAFRQPDFMNDPGVGIFDTRRGSIVPGTAPPADPTGVAGKSTPNRGPTAADTRQQQLLLSNVQDLAGKFGGTITSSGVRPVGTPNDTGTTIVNGHQTQWGLYNSAPPEQRGVTVAYPGTSAHGNGMAVDIVVPPAQQAAFKKEAAARGLAILDETDSALGSHYHVTASGALVAPPKATTPKPFNENAFATAWKTSHGYPTQAPLGGDFLTQYNTDLARAKAAWGQQQGGGTATSAIDQLLQMK